LASAVANGHGNCTIAIFTFNLAAESCAQLSSHARPEFILFHFYLYSRLNLHWIGALCSADKQTRFVPIGSDGEIPYDTYMVWYGVV